MVSEEFKKINRLIFDELSKSSDWTAEWDEEGFITFLIDDNLEYIVSGCADMDKSLPSHMSLAYHCVGIKGGEDILERVNEFNFDIDTVRACWFEQEALHGIRFDIHYSLGFVSPDRYIDAVKWGIGQIRQVLDMFVGEGKLFQYDED